jgi:hypothetical protein
VRGQNENFDPRLHLAQTADELDSRPSRQGDVGNHQGGRELPHQFHGIEAIGGFTGDLQIVLELEEGAQPFAQNCVILDEYEAVFGVFRPAEVYWM